MLSQTTFFFGVMASLACSTQGFAWGPGHADVQRAILERLPASLQYPLDEAARRQLIEKDSKYPDSFGPFERARIGEDAMKRLEQSRITRRYDVHSDKGRAIAFIELIHALRERRMDRANFWIAGIAHTFADMSGLNHDPLGHIATYAWAEKDWALRTVSGKPLVLIRPLLDIHWSVNQPEGYRRLGERIQQMRLRDDGRALREALLSVMLAGHEGAAFLAPRGSGTVEAAVGVLEDGDDLGSREKLIDGLSDLAAWSIVRMLRDVDVAIRLAATEVPLTFGDDVQNLYNAAVVAHMRERTLDDGIYTRLVERQAAPADPAVVVVVEPAWRMNESFLGFAERVWSAAIMYTLMQEKIEFRVMDIRSLLVEGPPAAKAAPVLVLPARRITDIGWMKAADLSRQLQRYLEDNGRVLWIGGAPPPKAALPEIADAMQMSPSSDKQWPVPLGELMQSRVAWSSAPRDGWKFARSPVTKAGWQVPVCPYIFTPAATIDPLLELQLQNGQRLTVGGSWPSGKPTAIFVPTYAVFPFLLTPGEVVSSPAQPTLDGAGQQVLFHCLQRLGLTLRPRPSQSR